MVECRLSKLVTSFSPERIRLVIELNPLNGEAFDLPIGEAGAKLSQVANYAITTFGVRTTPIDVSKATPNGNPGLESGPPGGPPDKSARKQAALSKMLKAGPQRAIQVLEGELARAKAENNPNQIVRAEEQLARAKVMAETLKENP